MGLYYSRSYYYTDHPTATEEEEKELDIIRSNPSPSPTSNIDDQATEHKGHSLRWRHRKHDSVG